MFTGIIEETGKLKSLGGGRITISAKKILADINIGDSIAVNGICLTVTSFGGDFFTADVMPETLRRTSLENLPAGSLINLERALTLSSRLGGHIVSGHIDGAGKIIDITAEKNAVLIKVTADKEIIRYIAVKGSVALDGISLTVADVDENSFVVSLIPHSMSETNLHTKKIGSFLNIETDIIAKYVERFVAAPSKQGITYDFLTRNGFCTNHG